MIFACRTGELVTIDDCDAALVAHKQWFVVRGPSRYGRYVGRSEHSRTILLHREIMAAPHGLTVDHIDGDTFNNCRANLRLCTAAQNRANKHNFKRTSSGFRGVYEQASGRYAVIIGTNHRYTYLGTFDDPIEAARVWDAEALARRGEFAQLNFPISAPVMD